MAIDTDKIAQEAIDAIAEKIKNLNTLNIIVAGKTGVGKSTLINAVFRDKLAETGMGKPVTDHMRKISKKGIPLAIYDTKGFELGRDVQQQVKQEVMETISKGLATQDINKAIHCIWYCIKLDIENPIIRINTAFKGCSSLEKISVLPRIYHN